MGGFGIICFKFYVPSWIIEHWLTLWYVSVRGQLTGSVCNWGNWEVFAINFKEEQCSLLLSGRIWPGVDCLGLKRDRESFGQETAVSSSPGWNS